MVKEQSVLISEFAREAGISVDTARFYVRRGLLKPALTKKGGRNPYMVFGADHVEAIRVIRTAQSLGLTLREIEAINTQYAAGKASRESNAAIVTNQLAALRRKAAEIKALTDYLEAKLHWLNHTHRFEDEPLFSNFV